MILSVGEVNKNKNHKIGIEALAQLKDKSVYYVICGRGFLIENYKELTQSLKIGDRVILAGYRTDVADFYKMADVFLFPSFREGLPVSVMEAMASGLPVIATKIRGSSDIVEDKKNGILLQPNDVKGVANAIDAICNSKMLCQMSLRNKETAVRYDLSKIVEQYKKAYFSEDVKNG